MARARGGDAPARPGQLLAVLGPALLEDRQGALGRRLGALGLGPVPGRLGQGRAGGLNGPGEPGLLDGGGLGPALELLGVRAPDGAGGAGQAAHALGGDVGEGGEGLGGRRELLPHARGARQAPPARGLGGGQFGQARTRRPLGLLGLGPTARQEGLVGLAGLQERLGLGDVVGQQPGGGVADLDLDGAGAPGDGGLAGERPELTAQLVGQVGHPGQVGGHGLELAQGALLAAAVLEDPGGLLDEAAAVIGRGGEDLVEPPLADDDVHLAAQARVAQQLLDVQEAADGAVDLVLRAAPAEEGAGDGDLGVVDRQGAVGVVDGQGDLGPAQRRARAGPGEDDVGHGPAAQVLGPLLAHDPGQGVHDIGLARAVGADDGGDARLQAQGRRRGEGLEALDRQRLEVHEATISAPGAPVRRPPPPSLAALAPTGP